jgi:hypothetical protein
MTRTIISISEDEKRWLENYSRKQGISSAEVVRRAIKEYRRNVSRRDQKTVIRETSGAWTSLKGDSQDHVDRIRGEWERSS